MHQFINNTQKFTAVAEEVLGDCDVICHLWTNGDWVRTCSCFSACVQMSIFVLRASSCLKSLYTVIVGDHRKIRKKKCEERNHKRTPLHIKMLFQIYIGKIKKNRTKFQKGDGVHRRKINSAA